MKVEKVRNRLPFVKTSLALWGQRKPQRNKKMICMKFKITKNYQTGNVTTWTATNAHKFVRIIKNEMGGFEFWNGNNCISMHADFDTARRNAESVVPFKMTA
jgi:hypothetical protein